MPRPRKSDALRLRAERKATLLNGAATAFLTTGFHASSMDDVATAAGVSKVVLYRFFEGKDALMTAILEQGVSDIAEADRLWFEVSRYRGGGLLGALAHIRRSGAPPRLVMEFAARDPQYRSFYDSTAETTRQRTAKRLSKWLGRKPGFHPMWDPIVIQIADFSLNGFMRWLESGKPSMDADFELWMQNALRGLAHAARDQLVEAGTRDSALSLGGGYVGAV